MGAMAEKLPIYEIERELVAAVERGRRLIVQAPTGSGKSTQVPQMLLKGGLLDSGEVVVLQPRRLATRMLAVRVARELSVALGQEVGYQIRFESRVSERTRIRYVTEGVLLRQMIQNPELDGVSALIFDEFHERHLYGDITLAQALELQARRPDLILIVMSATLELSGLQEYLAPCEVLSSEGRVYPVEIGYYPQKVGPSQRGYLPVWEHAAEAFAAAVRQGHRGDSLIFMPGSFEIHKTLEALRNTSEAKGHILLPLHGELSSNEQDAAVEQYEAPKIVVATNVAETSLTISGVRLVIDSGLARIPRYDAVRGMNTLFIERISQASTEQRAGRAGRTAPGRCLRLWAEREQWSRPPQEVPEVRRLDLAEVILTLKAAGINDLRAFRWLEAPDELSLSRAETLLRELGALSPDGAISAIGRKMLAFPVHPRYSRMLLAAQEYGCVRQAAMIAALTQGRNLLLRQVGREVEEFRDELFGEEHDSDFWLLMRAWNYVANNQFNLSACRRAGVHGITARQVQPLLEMFLDIAQRQGLEIDHPMPDDESIRKCVLVGFSDRLAKRLDQGSLRCLLSHGRTGLLSRESVVQSAPFFVAAEISEIEGRDKSVSTLLSLATAVETSWLEELYPEEIELETFVSYDSTSRTVLAEEQLLFRGIALAKKALVHPGGAAGSRNSRAAGSEFASKAAELLAEEVLAGRLQLKHWDHALEQWILRLNSLARWCPELELAPIEEENRRAILQEICYGAYSYKEIKEADVKSVVKSWLSYEQQRLLERHAPERLELSNGKKPKLVYSADASPHIALRIQELFDVKAVPKIAQGRVPVIVQILAPNMRPVQVTQDLENFWVEHYPKLKSQLQRKYPKHEWR
jgi:ATP-dependent helicase HrpB